ncbi:VWA domain-containing protein [Candidatus Pacearchaeota archaeon]|jgi:uncharacterized protein YegL|nr:VWA domain-containing protein [Candidatus Pacearchaeota archaeon]
MTDKNLTEIVAIIDRSGSMHGLTKDTIGGFNSFLAEQKKNSGKAKLTLVQFDDKYQIDYDGADISSVKDLDESTYMPRGNTALLDAVGKTIVTIGERLSKTPEDERPGQVIFLIITDGQENASKDYREAAKIAEMVKHQTDTYNWTFLFLGGGDAAFSQGMALGFSANNTHNYSANAAGTSNLYRSVSKGVSRRREKAAEGVLFCASMSLLDADEVKSLKTE